MQPSTANSLKAVAPAILSGQYTESTPFCPEIVKRAIAILNILKDGGWHTSLEISATLGIGRRYAADILKTCSVAWNLESHRRNGWKLNQLVCPACRSIYWVSEDDPDWHECECGWHKVDA